MTSWIPLDETLDNMSEEQQMNALENQLAYLYSKAELFILLGADKYRKGDFFNEPQTNEAEELKILHSGCLQICNGKGFNPENPMVGIGVFGFYDLMRLFHFEAIYRETNHSFEFNGKKGALDGITFEHGIDGRTTSLYNFCEYPHLDEL
jgi:hypothetical protein